MKLTDIDSRGYKLSSCKIPVNILRNKIVIKLLELWQLKSGEIKSVFTKTKNSKIKSAFTNTEKFAKIKMFVHKVSLTA